MTAKVAGRAFTATDMLRTLIREEPLLLMLLRRFGISLGFGNATVAEVCERDNIDTATFLAVANFTSGREWQCDKVCLHTLIVYLKNAHDFFLGFALPTIRRKLLESMPIADPSSIAMLILRYFDDYVEEVRLHMNFENDYVFPYIEGLLSGRRTPSFNITDFEASHRPLAPKLQELKELFVAHFHGAANEDLLTSTLFDIITCERDLLTHCSVEDHILVPAVEALEPTVELHAADSCACDDGEGEADEASTPDLTAREREIVQCIARGMSTKEIAERLFLSAHTVNTHRRNICAKLDIHSPAAITIYAIMNGLVDMSEIDHK